MSSIPASVQKKRRPPAKKLQNRQQIGLLFIAPWLIGFLAFQLYPFLSSLFYSFTDYTVIKSPVFVGLANYKRLFLSDPEFLRSLTITFQYALFSVPAKLIFALFVAVVLNQKLKGINFYRTVYYLPSILGGSVAISVLWKLLFVRDGTINRILMQLGLSRVDWLGPSMALFTIGILQVWQFGSSMVLFLAALKQVPSELYEAARVDGASRVKVFFTMTLPMISSIIFFNLVMQTINALQNFTSAFVVTNGGPAKATYVLGMKLYVDAFNHFRMGYASAISWVLFIIIFLFTMLIFKSSDAWVYYEDGGKSK